MKKKITILGGLLVLQAFLILAISFRSEGLQSHQGMQALLDFNREQVDRILVADGEQRSELKRSGDSWTTAEGFPVEADRVDRLLDRLKELQHGLAVAQTEASLKRFKLSDDEFERRVELYADGKEVASLTLGSGAGARRSHVRAGDGKEIYAVALGSYDLPADIAQWQDKTLLQLEADQVAAVRIGDLTVRKEAVTAEPAGAYEGEEASSEVEPETTWVAEGLTESESFELDNFESDLDRLLSMRYTRAYPAEEAADLVDGKDAMNHIHLQLRDGKQPQGISERTYQVYKAKEGGGHFVTVSDREEWFEVSAYLGGRLGEQLVADKLVKVNEATAEDTATSAEEEGASESAVEEDSAGSETANHGADEANADES
ncbi:DUF4340 domain-containing protein [Coraliomargarita sp. SDUM461003]|uniref:DUF4340 domain-containing protein n=1 Tax=Thalassobacterium maritimum TaxID=3041265 RepID=A0ABU1AZ39_9BACT|nr:DUF4340 domain-containing protein [Coraliomargarita sp. SDUM461003]MDQ8209413.1 DUF4340 domain-containing protein [Coraliomargarita sp. SDUM461003]